MSHHTPGNLFRRLRLAAALLCLSSLPAKAQTYGIYRELWTNLTIAASNTLNVLTNTTLNPDWPTNPASSFTKIFTNFEADAATGMTNYGQRMRAFISPLSNGLFRFTIASDDSSQLLLSSSEEPTSAVRIAWLTAAGTNRQWNKETNQQSAPIYLESRRRYYLEAQMQQSSNSDHLAVRWFNAINGMLEEPLSTLGTNNTLLVPFTGVTTTPTFASQPSNVTTTAGLGAQFAVFVTNRGPVGYQWMQSGTNIAGATKSILVLPAVARAMSGTTFRCVVTNAAGTVTSSVATLSVLAAPSYGLYREMWLLLTNSLGNTLNALTNPTYNVNWPTNPAFVMTRYYTNFETETSTAISNYGQRVRAYVVPPTNGAYTFWIASDDTARLALSSDENPSNAVSIATVSGAVGSRVWTTQTNQRSAPIVLEKGRRYYLEGQMQQGTGGDNFAVRWTLPNGTIEEPLTATGTLGTVLVPYNGIAEPPGIARQPMSTSQVENTEAVFHVLVTNKTQVYYQWTSNGTAIAGATTAGVTISNTVPAMSGIVYRCLISNALGVVTSDTATLSVTLDTTAPALRRAYNVGVTNVRVLFTEPTLPADATNVANYAITNGGISVLAAQADTNGLAVTLTVSPLAYSSNYWLRVSGLRDLAATPNWIATNSTTNFLTLAYVPEEIGAPAVDSGVTSASSNSLTIIAAGGSIQGTNDQFSLYWQQQTGDFDVKVRLASVSLADAWSKAGLMARASLNTTSLFAAAFGTPSLAGCYFQYRVTNGATAVMNGSVPVNWPNTWLRLQRATNTFYGYGSMDGSNWLRMGTIAITAMPVTVYLGLAVSSHQTNGVTTTADFRDIGSATGEPLGTFTLRNEPLGPSSRRTGLVFSEIMYHPAVRTDGKNVEFVELYNAESVAEEMGGMRLSGDIDYTFPTGTVLKAGGFLVVARVPADVQSVYGISDVLGPYTNGLPDSGGTLRLRDEVNSVLLDVNYDDRSPWPLAADGTGHSLVLARASYGENDPRAWAPSDTMGGTPGAWNASSNEPLAGVFINEFLAHTDPPLQDYVELYNRNSTAVDLSGCWISDTIGTNLYRIPNGTVVTAGGFAVFTEADLGFRLDALGEQVLLINSNATRVLDAIDFEAQENAVSMGRVPDGGAAFYPLASRTPAAANGPRRLSDIVINELMYSPPSGNADDQYVELYNRGTSNVNISGWQFTAGIDFTFPSNTVLAAGGYLTIAKNAAHLMTNYPNLNATNCLGNFNGQLSGGGERVVLAFPDDIVDTNGVTNVARIVVSEVTYADGGRWGTWSDGEGSSMELVNPDADPRLPDSWADSDESGKIAPWTTIEYTGPLMETVYSPTNDYLHLYLLGRGECLVDDVELLTNGVSVTVTNSGFEAGQGTWTFLGAYDQSTVEAGGYSGAMALHIRGTARGDTGQNRIQSARFVPLNNGDTNVTLRCKARWLRGWPELMLRMHGGSIEATGALPLPPNLGTPGLVNSRYVSNAPPGIFNVGFWPILPQFGEPVTVTASAADADGLAALTLRYRVDPTTSFTELGMNDGGTNGDAVAGDGVFSAALPAQNSTNIIAFHLAAVDALGTTGTYPRVIAPTGTAVRLFPEDSVTRDLLVRWGEVQMAAGFPTYHLWMTATNRGRWLYRDRLNNGGISGTFVYNNCRAIHFVPMQFGGSPFHLSNMDSGPDGADRNDYNISVPDDEPLLGVTDLTFVVPGNANGSGGTSDLVGTAEQIAFMIFRKIGVPYLHRRYIHLYYNGNQRSTFSGLAGSSVYEDAQQPNSAYLAQWFDGNTDGRLHKIEDWFEYNTNGTAFSNNDADFTRRVITGTTNLNIAAYRFMFRPRALGPGESANDYSGVTDLVNALSPTAVTTAGVNVKVVNDVANLDGWYREIACQRTIGNYDSYGWDRGKNNFFYWVPGGRCELLPWDADQILGIAGSRSNNASIYGGSGDPRAIKMQSEPLVQRFYHRAFRDILDGPLRANYLEGLFAERIAALLANGCNYSVANYNAQYTWVGFRRTYLETELARIQTNFAIATPTNNSVVASNYVTLTGTAPIQAADISINGSVAPVTWISSNRWSLTVALNAGTNAFLIAGVDRNGNAITNGTPITLNLMYSGASASPTGFVSISEMLYAPAVTNAGFIELFNSSTNLAFDLSGWTINGLGYTFPAGSVLPPRQQAFVADDVYTFAQTFGTSSIPLGEFPGNFDPDGETISLLMNDAATTLVDRVRYEAVAPWPLVTNGLSLQAIDVTNDNSRVSNWGMGTNSTPGATNTMAAALPAYPALWLNEVQGSNDAVIADNSGEREPWVELYYAGTGTLSLADYYLSDDYTNLLKWAFPTNATIGSNSFRLVWCDAQTNQQSGTNWHANFRIPADAGRVALSRVVTGTPQIVDYLNYTNVPLNWSYGDLPDGQPFYRRLMYVASPRGTNNGTAAPVTVRINEWMADNATTVDPADGNVNEDWIELYNYGTQTVQLAGFYLTDNLSTPNKWTFPTNATIVPGGFLLVWADDETNQNAIANGDVHAAFKLSKGGEDIGLFSPSLVAVDTVTFGNQTADITEGRWPDASDNRYTLAIPTPRTNNIVNTNNVPASFTNTAAWAGDELTALAFVTTAVDTDRPPQTLTYGLVGAPAGAAINPTNGTFSWYPTETDGPGTNMFFVTATDNGWPAQTASQQITLVVNEVNLPPVAGVPATLLTYAGSASELAVTPPTDPDLPANTFTYQLDTNAPAGASIDSTLGLIRWTPPDAVADTVVTMAVVVVDSGLPPLSATTLARFVVAPPSEEFLGEMAPGPTIRWNAASGSLYRVESADALPASVWQFLTNQAANSNGYIVIADPAATTNGTRFYRIIRSP